MREMFFLFYIAICDDDSAVMHEISDKVSIFFTEKQIPHKIYCFENASVFWTDMKECINRYDVFILDLEMPGLSGKELIQQIKQLRNDAYIILLTCHEQFVYDGYEWGVYRFISKANYEGRLLSALMQVYKNVEAEKGFYLYHSPDGEQKLYYKDILYITKSAKNSIFHTKSCGDIPLRISLAKLYNELDPEVFCFVDRSCIININHITSIKKETNSVTLLETINVTISKSKINKLHIFMNENWYRGNV